MMSREMVKIVENYLEIQMVREEVFGTSCSKSHMGPHRQAETNKDARWTPLRETFSPLEGDDDFLTPYFVLISLKLFLFLLSLRERNDIPS